MTAPGSGARELSRGLLEALRPALAADASTLARLAARDVAQVLGLAGLEAALTELGRHDAAVRPREVSHLADRIARLADAVERAGDVTPFVEADRELVALAERLASTEWGAPTGAHEPVAPTLNVADALADLSIEAGPEADRARLSLAVASALRAALDWLGLEEGARVAVKIQDSALTILVRGVHEAGLGPAGAVLASVEGSLGREREGGWLLRVPRATERPSFLLVRQGHLGFALPWHAVARLRMLGRDEADPAGATRLDPLVHPEPGGVERPAALVALGLTRAWFVADRVVWRIAALPQELDEPAPVPGAHAVVEMEGGERFWVMDVAWLLRGVEPLAAPPPLPRPRMASPAPPVVPVRPEAPASLAPAREAAPATERIAPPPERRAAPILEVLSPPPTPSGTAPIVEEFAPPPAPAPEAAPVVGEFAPPPTAGLAARDPAGERTSPENESMATAIEGALAQLRAKRAASAPQAARPASPAAASGAAPAPAPSRSASSLEPPAVSPPAPLPKRPPAPAPTPPPEAAAKAPSASPAPARARRALVADDSLVARMFLTRMLEKRGWMVVSVNDAASLWQELVHGPWELVCADLALPDARGRGHVTRLLDYIGRCAEPPICIVLTRDAADETIALDAGATRLLRKPFEPDRLDALLPR
ncbi:MAG TPA: response regulator [Candidatus Acidoferrales bacterium]|nr:response regulator [Candidatus Acidoferrales bacterium]